jgi:CBS domain-containing protein
MINRQMSEIIRRHKPITLPAEASVHHACQMMRDHRIGAILVTDADGKLLGIFTGRDAVSRVAAEGLDARATKLAHVMTHRPHTMPPHKRAIEALRLMHDGGFRHIPVVDDERIVGIVSHGDFRGLEHDRLDEETGYWERIG